ncbi:MAG: trypsin-like peptidase domain-containing protein [Pseudorhodobacter sp.]|nr:trypsin-like peptidase domain-containing protein [Rhizobacter sp.]
MKKAPLYSSSRPANRASVAAPEVMEVSADSAAASSRKAYPPASHRAALSARWKAVATRYSGPLWGVAGALLVAIGMLLQHQLSASGPALTQGDISEAVRTALENDVMPSPYARAHEAIAGAVVRVVGLDDESAASASQDATQIDPSDHRRSTGSGVVIIDNGTILTNLHVITGAKRIRVTFANGHESDAVLINAQPENDLAVLRAKSIPDDLEAATMRSSTELRPGDQVMAVGFPFGIGPSVSGGVVSGLKRQFRSPEGGQRIANLIQFDAAANPGNSGGPLVTMDGAVVGIVTAILNPGDAGTFIGIAFAVPIENAASAAGMPPF